jgi:tripartite motif-containing protein 71
VVDSGNHRIQYFNATGSYLGQWGEFGNGNGEFNGPGDIAITAERAFVSDRNNDRVQYFDDTEYAVYPTSLGRVKALFE